MRVFLSLVFILFQFTSAGQPQRFPIRQMTGYYLDSKVPLSKGFNFMVISREKIFQKYFGKIEKEDYPNFDFEHVVVMAMPPTNEQYFLRFADTAAKAGNFIEIYCAVRTEKHKITYLDHPIVVAAIPKYFSVTKINFYNDETKKLMKTVWIR